MLNSRILIVDDEKSLLQMVSILLKKEGFSALDNASTGSQALKLIENHEYDLILLDINLPDIDGYTICTEIRRTKQVPIFFLTARDSDFDKVSGFAFGADDYITKPFNPLELIARIKAHLKRKSYVTQTEIEKTEFNNGQLIINYNEATVKVNGKVISLTAQLFQLLCFFSKSPNQIFSKEQIYVNVWGDESYGDDTTVTVHIRKLREKIEEEPSNPKHIITIRGLGYKFVSSKEK